MSAKQEQITSLALWIPPPSHVRISVVGISHYINHSTDHYTDVETTVSKCRDPTVNRCQHRKCLTNIRWGDMKNALKAGS